MRVYHVMNPKIYGQTAKSVSCFFMDHSNMKPLSTVTVNFESRGKSRSYLSEPVSQDVKTK